MIAYCEISRRDQQEAMDEARRDAERTSKHNAAKAKLNKRLRG